MGRGAQNTAVSAGKEDTESVTMENKVYFSPNGQNRTPDVVTALLHAKDNTTLIFENGTYDFYADGAYRGYFFPGCNRSGDKLVIFPMLHLHNVVIEGNGAKFLFHDRVFPFILQDCENTILRDFSIDFSFPRCLEAAVTAVDEDGFFLHMDVQQNGCSVNEHGNMVIRAGSELFSSSERRFFLEQRDWHCFLSIGDIYYENINPPAAVVICDAEQQEDGIRFHYREGSEPVQFTVGKPLMISYDELRENDVIFLERCQNTEVRNVRIYHGAGMGIVGQCCENLILDHYVVDPGDDGLSSTTADAILLTNFSGTVQMTHCVVDRSVDDAISIHGFYTRVDTVTDRCKAAVRMVHLSQAGTNPYFPGDRLVISDGETMCCRGFVTVKRAFLRDDPAVIFLETEETLDGLLRPGDILENPERTPEVLIQNCTFRNFPAIRLSSAKKTVFEDNRVENCTALLLNDLVKYWSVSGCVRDVTIRNNQFANMDAGIRIFSERPMTSDIRHQNITIVGNLFRNCAVGIDASAVDHLTICGNRYENVGTPYRTACCTDVVENDCLSI